jgi:hypothetical protein
VLLRTVTDENGSIWLDVEAIESRAFEVLIARRIWVIREHLDEDWALALDCLLTLRRLWQNGQRDGE